MSNLKNNLRELLQKSKLSENELARRTGIPQQIINRMLSGVNKNPKISTILPIVRYFGISIDQLIGELNNKDIRLNTEHYGWSEVPLIAWEEIGITNKSSKKCLTIPTDAPVSKEAFAVKMPDDSMELKFYKNTILIFEPKKDPKSHDFVLINSTLAYNIIFRQVIFKDNNVYIKCLNPKLECYKAQKIGGVTTYFGVLVQSKVDHF